MTGANVGSVWWWVLKPVGFIVASFVFSYIFWKTKQCVDNCSKKRKK